MTSLSLPRNAIESTFVSSFRHQNFYISSRSPASTRSQSTRSALHKIKHYLLLWVCSDNIIFRYKKTIEQPMSVFFCLEKWKKKKDFLHPNVTKAALPNKNRVRVLVMWISSNPHLLGHWIAGSPYRHHVQCPGVKSTSIFNGMKSCFLSDLQHSGSCRIWKAINNILCISRSEAELHSILV